MTVSSGSLSRAGPFVGDGTLSLYSFTFKVFTSADVKVVQTGSNVTTTLVLGTDYSVSLNADQETAPGGMILLSAPLASGYLLVILSAIASTQGVELTNNGNFSPIVLNNEFDKLTLLIKQAEEVLSRTLTLAPTVPGSGTFPAPIATEVLGWDAAGEHIINYPFAGPGSPFVGDPAQPFYVGDAVAPTQAAALRQVGRVVASYAAVRALDSTVTNYTMTQGRSSVGDGGQGWFRADASDTTSADNDGTVLVAADGMRWKRSISGSGYFIEWWGADNTGAIACDTAFENGKAAALAVQTVLRAGRGNFLFNKSHWGGGNTSQNNTRNNLSFIAEGRYKTQLISDLDEAYPLFDLLDSKGARLEGFQILTSATSLETAQILCAETTATGANNIIIKDVVGYIASGAGNAVACVVGVNADQLSIDDSIFTSYQSGAHGGIFTQANATGITSKFGTLSSSGGDATYIMLNNAEFLGTDASGLRVDDIHNVVGKGVYSGILGTTVPAGVCQMNGPNANVLISIVGLRIENHTTATGETSLMCNGGAVVLDISGSLPNSGTGVIIGGTALVSGQVCASVDNLAFLFEGGAQPVPGVKFINMNSHGSNIFQTLPTALSAANGGLYLATDHVSAAQAVANIPNVSGGKSGAYQFATPTIGIAYPGSSAWLGHPNSTIYSLNSATTTTGVAETTLTTFLSKLIPISAVDAVNLIQGGATPVPFMRLKCSFHSILASGDTATLAVLLGATTIATVTIPYEATGNAMWIELLFKGMLLKQIKISVGGQVVYAMSANVAPGGDVDFILQQSSTIIDPFSGEFQLLCEYV